MSFAYAKVEFRRQLPYTGLVVFLGLSSLIFSMIEGYPDQYVLKDVWVLGFEELELYNAVYFFLAFLLAIGMLVREQDQRTIEFLDALPISRFAVFATKAFLGMAILMLLPTLECISALGFIGTIPESRGTPDPIPWMRAVWFMCLCQIFLFFSFGLAVSFARRFAWLIAGIVTLILMLVQHIYPPFAALNPAAMFPPEFQGNRILIPWTACGLALGAGTVFMGIAFLWFRAGTGRWARRYARLKDSHLGSFLLIGTSAIIVIGALGGLMWFAYSDYDEEAAAQEYSFPESGYGRVETDLFDLHYPTAIERRALLLAERADACGKKVSTFFDHPIDPTITVDITPSLQQHHAGVAFWNRVRIDSKQLSDTDEAEAILGHEVTHVLIDRVSDRRLKDSFNSNKMFHEGLATYLEYRYFRSNAERRNYRLQAAVYHDRGQIRFDEMVDYQSFRNKYDAATVYPLGERFVDAIVNLYGDEAVVKVLKAFSREDAPENLSGEELWQDAFQAADYNLDRVIDEFFALLEKEVERTRDRIDLLPRLYAHVSSDFNDWTVEVQDPPKGDIYCVVRPSAQADEQYHVYANEIEPGVFKVSRLQTRGNQLWYRLIYRDPDSDQHFSEPWKQATR